LADRSPLSSGFEEWLDKAAGLEACTQAGLSSQALMWAYMLQTATVSFGGHADWEEGWVKAQCTELDDDGEPSSFEAQVRNASSPRHVDEHSVWIRQLGLEAVPGAAQLWGERADRFGDLRFLPRVADDLARLESSGAPYVQAVSTLTCLNADAGNWQDKSIWPLFSTKVTPEAERRKKFCYSTDDLSQSEELFDQHARFTGGVSGRIHFRVSHREGKLVVAYVGSKLDGPI
jgi:hypothetical protein